MQVFCKVICSRWSKDKSERRIGARRIILSIILSRWYDTPTVPNWQHWLKLPAKETNTHSYELNGEDTRVGNQKKMLNQHQSHRSFAHNIRQDT